MARKVTVNFQAASTASRKVIVDFAAPAAPAEPTRVFMRAKTHSYLLLRESETRTHGYFLTMDSGQIEVVRVDLVTEVIEEPVKADKKRGIAASPGKHREVYRIWLDRESSYDLEPHQYDLKAAVQNYHSSLLGRTVEAEREMRSILGLPELDTAKQPEDLLWETKKVGTKEVTGAVKGLPKPQAERKPKEPRQERVKGYTLAELCAELKKDPTEARKALRGSKVQKPGGTWEWASKEAASEARKVIEAI